MTDDLKILSFSMSTGIDIMSMFLRAAKFCDEKILNAPRDYYLFMFYKEPPPEYLKTWLKLEYGVKFGPDERRNQADL